MSISRKSKCQLRKRLQNYIIDLPGYEKSQIRYCGYKNDANFEAHEKVHQDDLGNVFRGVYFTGYQTCGSIFCPVCSGLIKTYRAHELNTFCKQWHGSIHFLTFTISHSRSDRLDHLFDILKTSYRNFLNHYGTKRILGHVDGTVRSFEVTRKNNGWHPHFHCLFFLSLDFSFSDESICELKKIWSSSVKRAGGKADPDIGLRVQRGDNAASYICKLGSELQGQECKNSRDFLQLLVNRQKSLVQEYLTALKGVNWLKWSRDLRSRLSLSDITDNQIVEGVPFFNKRKLPVSQLMLNFLEDVFFQHDLDGKGRDTLVDFLNSKSNRMFQHGPEFLSAFDDYCNLKLPKNRRFIPDPHQFFRDMQQLGLFDKCYFE